VRQLTDELHWGKHNFVVEADIKGFLDPYSYYTLAVEGCSKSWVWLSNTRMRKPFCLPRLTWTTESSPRFNTLHDRLPRHPQQAHGLRHGDITGRHLRHDQTF